MKNRFLPLWQTAGAVALLAMVAALVRYFCQSTSAAQDVFVAVSAEDTDVASANRVVGHEQTDRTDAPASVAESRPNLLAKWMLANGIDVNARNVNGETALHRAARAGNAGIVRMLLTEGGDVDIKDNEGASPLYVAVASGNEYIARLLLDSGANCNTPNIHGDSPLHEAARQGHEVLVALLLDRQAAVNEVTHRGKTPLHLAATHDRVDIVRALLDRGASVDSQDYRGIRPLHVAAQHGNRQVASLLMEHGAEHDLATAVALGNEVKVAELLPTTSTLEETVGGISLLHSAVRAGRVKTIKLLLEAGINVKSTDDKGRTALHLVAPSRSVELAEQLIEVDVNMPDFDGFTSLHVAVKNGQHAMVKHLLTRGANVQSRAVGGGTALHLAVLQLDQLKGDARIQLVKTLLEHGADAARGDDTLWTPLHEACWHGNDAAVALFVHNVKNTNIQDDQGLTPLHVAARGGHARIVGRLIAAGADITSRAVSGDTPLHAAAGYGGKDLAMLLLEAGADLNASANNGRTPLHVAVDRGNGAVLNVLLSKGADVTVEDESGLTALHIAAMRNDSHVIRRLVAAGAKADLSILCMLGKHETAAKLIRSKRANVNKSVDGLPLTHTIIGMNNVKLLQLAIQHGAKLEAMDDHYQRTSLHVAAHEGQVDLAKLLLKAKAPVDVTDAYRLTPMHLAAREGRSEVIELFLGYGADVQAKDYRGSTPLHWAARKGYYSIVKSLVDHGADMSEPDRYGDTALHHVAATETTHL